jgi:N-acetylglucosamine-6-phosphate deacetylase
LTIRLLTLAPELPGSLDVIRFAVDRDIRVAIGHTDATWDESRAAVDAGATLGTHLFNAMRPLHHREPGAAGFLLNSNVAVSVVADGIHVAPEMLQLISRIKGPDEMVIVSDSLAGLGMPPGRYSLGGVEVFTDGVTGRRVDGTLSGSVTPLSDGLRNLINAGLAPEWAVAAATVNPARVLGLSRVHGSVRIGRPADLVVFDDEWSVSATIIGGRVAYRGRDVSSEKLETLAHRI